MKTASIHEPSESEKQANLAINKHEKRILFFHSCEKKTFRIIVSWYTGHYSCMYDFATSISGSNKELRHDKKNGSLCIK